MSARIFPFVSSPLSEIVYLDTSFVWELYDPQADATRQAQCLAFLNRLTQAGVVMIMNSWIIQELRHIILVGVYRPEAQRHRMGWLELFRRDKSLMPTAIQEIRRVEALLRANPLIASIPIQLGSATDAEVLDLMRRYNLDSANAYHIAIAHKEQVNSFVTLDQGFGVADALNLYTSDPVLLQRQTTASAVLPFIENSISDL